MTPQLKGTSNGLRIAIEGCGHGTLHAIYASIRLACEQKSWPAIDLLIIGGDFQSVRNAYDLNCVSMPAKYRSMCDFHEYYSGQRTAPYLTIFVGGNHEASNYLHELYYGGWVAPNIYYMGATNVLRLGELRIAGMSGIWKGFDYRKLHHERLPYNESDTKSIYHVRESDVRKLLQIMTPTDIAISHDWPQGVEWKGDHRRLFRKKQHFEEDAKTGRLGSVAAKQVLDRLRPRYWFSAHLHCKYAAVVQHAHSVAKASSANGINPAPVKNNDEIDLDLDDDVEPSTNPKPAIIANADEIDLELEDDTDGLASVVPGQGLDGAKVEVDAEAKSTPSTATVQDDLAEAKARLPDSFRPRPPPVPVEHPPGITNTTTNFLALDKCLPNRDFLQLLTVSNPSDLPIHRPLKLSYDREWLSITRAFTLTEPPVFGNPNHNPSPAKSPAEYQDLISVQRKWVDAHFPTPNSLGISENFSPIAPTYDGGNFADAEYQQGMPGCREYPNPQTEEFCRMLEMPNPLAITEEEIEARMAAGPKAEENAGRVGFGYGRGRGFGGGRGGGRGHGRGGGRGGRGRGGWSRGH